MSEKASDSGERSSTPRGPMSTDRMLQTVGGVLLAIIGFLCAYCFYQIQGHESRLTKVETRQDGSESTLKEVKDMIKDLNSKIDRLLEKRP